MIKIVAKRDFTSSVFSYGMNTEETGDTSYEWDPNSIDDPFSIPTNQPDKSRVLRPGDIFRHPVYSVVTPNREKSTTYFPQKHGKLNWKIDW